MKHFIIVAGTDYERIAVNKTPTDFFVYCKRRRDDIMRKMPKKEEEIIFYMFDIYRGKIFKHIYTLDKHTYTYSKKEETYKTFDPVKPSNYFNINEDEKRFHPKGKNIISKYIIYDSIGLLGNAAPGTLEEVSIFSHAYNDGPILVNSDRQTENYFDVNKEYIWVRRTGVDKNDYDMRQWDINKYLAEIQPEKLKNIKKAFSSNCKFRIWGCIDSSDERKCLAKVINNKQYKKTGLTGDEVFTFDISDQDIINFLNSDLKTNFKVNVKFQLKFSEIKTFYCQTIKNTYAYSGAKFFNIDFQSAVPTTYADIATPPPTFRINPKVLFVIPFFKEYLKMEFEKDLPYLNYGIFKPTYSCQ